MVAVELVKLALFIGVVQKFLAVVKPSAQDAKDRFTRSLALFLDNTRATWRTDPAGRRDV